MSEAAGELRPVTDYVKLPKDGEPYLEGHKCKNCGTIFMGARNVCSKCFARNEIEAVKLPSKGTLYSYTIVYRSFPGVEVPFVSAVVDIEGGGTVKGNLINVEPDPAKIEMGMNVDVIFKDAGRTDKKGNHYISYFFQPAA
ncbi:Zn-ribbon domain-containing OB-fold protein [Tepidicaulis sp. LMO-SS28]|uniref:Zn-ribbon domain-containing OB-fold protein n=1 Tax=Tepidicaulis sp. LMO-SS28 TaxID=3447455 RepID=UPI003EDE9F5D